MAISIHTGRRTPMAEINVTPLVDVMLVLLIIFMVTAPMMQEGLSLELPQATGTPLEKERNVEEIVISVAENGTIFVNETAVPEAGLVAKIAEMTKDNQSREVYLRGDKKTPYGLVVRIISALKTNGIANVGIITNPQEESTPGTMIRFPRKIAGLGHTEDDGALITPPRDSNPGHHYLCVFLTSFSKTRPGRASAE